MSDMDSKKTGQTPEALEETPGRAVLRVAKMRLVMVEYIDSENPQPCTRMAAVTSTGQVYFVDDKVIGRQSQKWFAEAVQKKLSGS